MSYDDVVHWSQDDMIEISLNHEDDFLKIKETLTRIGIPSYKDKVLYQSCHILHKRGKYYIVHFKELFALDGKNSSLIESDVLRRNSIINLLQEWGLCEVVDPSSILECEDLKRIKVLKFSEKELWNLKPKYNIGSRS